MSLPSQSPGRSTETPPSSGITTPATTGQASLSSSISNMWTGLVRRFSSESTVFPSDPYPQDSSLKDGSDSVYNPHRTDSPFRPPPLDPIILLGYKENTPRSAKLLSTGVAEEIRIMIPERLRIVEDWRLVYSLEQNGASLATLYKKARDYEGRRLGFVLVVRDSEGGTFGAYLSEYPRPAPTYFGNGECFLWRASILAALPPPPSEDTTHLARSATIATPNPEALGRASDGTLPETIRFKAFPYSGVNDYCINCETGFLSVGAGDGHYGLWLDDALERGHSARCQTFGNEPLSDEGEKFNVFGVELWVLGT